MPITLQQNAVCIEGGKALFYLWSSFYGEPVPDFDTLSPRTKQLWTERALEAIEAVGPTRAAAVRLGMKVVGRISPDEPYGVTA